MQKLMSENGVTLGVAVGFLIVLGANKFAGIELDGDDAAWTIMSIAAIVRAIQAAMGPAAAAAILLASQLLCGVADAATVSATVSVTAPESVRPIEAETPREADAPVERGADAPTTVTATKSASGDIFINFERDVAHLYLDEGKTAYLALSAGFDVFRMNLHTKQYEIGAVPGVGYGFKWAPKWWTLTPVLLSFDVYASAGVVDTTSERDGPDAFVFTVLGQLTLADWIGVGVGPELGLSLHKDLPNYTHPIIVLGVRKAI